MRAEEIDALLGGEAQKLADKYTSVPLDFMDGYGWAVTQICRLFPEPVPSQLTMEEIETIRIHMNAHKETLCNQKRWKEAKEYQQIVDKLETMMDAERKEE